MRCYRRRYIAGDVCLPLRQCTSTSHSWHNRASELWDTQVHQSWHDQPTVEPSYCIWGMMQKCVCQVPVCNNGWVAAAACWDGLNFSMVDDAINQWWKSLGVCIHADGGHFEHSLQCCLLDIQCTQHQHNRLSSQPPVPHNNLPFQIHQCLVGNIKTMYLPLDELVLQFTR